MMELVKIVPIFVGFCLIASVRSAPKNVLDICADMGAKKFADQVRATPYLSKLVTDSTEFNSSVTAFAYTDEAYNKAPAEFRDMTGQKLEWALEYHVALGRAADFGHTKDSLYPSLFPTPLQSLPLQDIRINTYNIYNAELGFHTVLTASGAEIQKADIPASNGVVHIIGKVMHPMPTGSNIPEFLAIEPHFSTLNFYLKNSSMLSSLATDPSSPLTLLAPTDDAFSKLTDKQKAKLQDKKTLTHVLTYHVVPSALYSAGMYDNQNVKALSGDTILVEKGIGGTFLAGKKISEFDITVTNGVVHALAEVMFPPGV